MKNLVRKTNFRVACDIYTCNNMATFEIGHEFTTHNNMLLCEDCMRDILEEGRNILAELYQKRVEENEKNSPDESDGGPESIDAVTPESEDVTAEDEKNEEISEKDEIKNESATDESVSVENESDTSAAEEHPEEKDSEEKSTKTKKRPSRKSSVVKETE